MKNYFNLPCSDEKSKFYVQSFIKLYKGVFVLAFSSLFFMSCSEDTVDSIQKDVDTSMKQEFELLVPKNGMIQIDAKSNIAKNNNSKKRATDAAGVDRGRFNISLNFLVPVTERQREVFETAAARWERIIIKDESSLPEEDVAGPLPSAFLGFPALNSEGPIDDVVIEVVLIPIDGPGNVLGAAGPRFIRTSNGLTISGIMQFDTADLQFLDDLDLFEDVIVHEMGHVLGVGTLWNTGGKMLRQGPATNPYFTGRKANVFWNAEGGEFELPIENIGGPGTAGGHWRESLLGNELMTGFINLGENPLSRITAGSMKDLGYGAASVGEQYDLERGTLGVNINELDELNVNGSQGINIANHEILLQPIGEVVDK